MKDIPYWMPDFEKLFLKVASNPSSLAWIGELQAFYQNFEGKEEYKSVRFKCDSLISFIYRYSGFLEESYEIDFRQIKENPPDAEGYWATISQIVRTSDELARTNAVIPYAYAFLRTPDENISKKHIVLQWYARIFAEEENSFFSSFNHLVRKMESFLEEKPDPTRPFFERIEYLNTKYINALVASNTFYMAYSKANEEERIQLTSEYLSTEPLNYYRERMKIDLKHLHAGYFDVRT
jgi:hypothetical protein